MLLYSNRTTTPSLHFRVHGQLFVKDLSILESEPRMGAEHCFNIYDGKKAILVAAGSQAEKIQWMEDISDAIQVRNAKFCDKPISTMIKICFDVTLISRAFFDPFARHFPSSMSHFYWPTKRLRECQKPSLVAALRGSETK